VAELELVEVVRKMLLRDRMPRSHDASLQEREHALDRVRVNVGAGLDVLAHRVVDVIVAALELLPNPCIAAPLVGDEPGPKIGVFCDCLLQVLPRDPLDDAETCAAIPFHHTDDGRLVAAVSATEASGLAADVCLVSPGPLFRWTPDWEPISR